MKKVVIIIGLLVSATFTTLQANQFTSSVKKSLNITLANVESYPEGEGIRGYIDCKKEGCNNDLWGRCNKASINGVQVADCQATESNGNCCGIETKVEEYQ